jgi:peptidoglycan hydrolase CwlO-like protein
MVDRYINMGGGMVLIKNSIAGYVKSGDYQSLKDSIDYLENLAAEATQKLDSMDKRNCELRAEIANLYWKIEGMVRTIDDLQSDKDYYVVQVAKLKEEMKLHCKSYEADVQGYQMDIQALMKKLRKYQNKYAVAASEVDCRSLDCERYKEKIAKLEGKVVSILRR